MRVALHILLYAEVDRPNEQNFEEPGGEVL